MPKLPEHLWKQDVVERSDGFWIDSGSGYFGPFVTRAAAEAERLSYEDYLQGGRRSGKEEGMSWNHRVLRRSCKTSDTGESYGIVEAFYGLMGKPGLSGWTERFQSPYGETLEELREDLTRMLAALDQPVLDEAEYLEALEAGAKRGQTERDPEAELPPDFDENAWT